MQDRYAGDLGDFSKFGILKVLAGLRDADAQGIDIVSSTLSPRRHLRRISCSVSRNTGAALNPMTA